jgi:hypothetical protein
MGQWRITIAQKVKDEEPDTERKSIIHAKALNGKCVIRGRQNIWDVNTTGSLVVFKKTTPRIEWAQEASI